MEIKRLQVILKTVERCNIACTYCYYFFAGDDSYQDRPPIMKVSTVSESADFLVQACRDIKIQEIQVVFHGGEPLMQKKIDFQQSCKMFVSKLSKITKLNFAIQTNGMLIDSEWIDLFVQFDCNVCVSLDGGKLENDRYRIDKKGRGTYDRVKTGIDLLTCAHRNGQLKQTPAILTVLNHEYDYKKIIKHFHEDLDVNWIGVLFPDRSHDNPFAEGESAETYGRIMMDLFDLQVSYGEERLTIRPVNDVLDFFQEKRLIGVENPIFNPDEVYIQNQIIVIQSDGMLSIDDSFMPALGWRMKQQTYSIKDVSLKSYLELPVFREIREAYQVLPKKCTTCNWKAICRGGDLENRYKESSGFAQESVYCTSLDMFYEHSVKSLHLMGYPKQRIINKLELI